MADKSKIEWTERTWNPVTGCTKVSPGCAHCYAETFAERWRGTPGHPYEQGFDLKLWPERLSKPLRWREPSMIFVNSMSDLFHEEVPFEYIAAVFGVMAAADRHIFQVLTKRPERMREFFEWREFEIRRRDLRWEPWRVCEEEAVEYVPDLPAAGSWAGWPLRNVWLGVSVESRRFTHRADALRQIPAAVRFVSAEPLLGPLIGCWEVNRDETGHTYDFGLNLSRIDWLIVGGESGPGARKMKLPWVTDLCMAAEASRTAFFFKQTGAVLAREMGLADRKGADPDEWPEGWPKKICAREMPEAVLA